MSAEYYAPKVENNTAMGIAQAAMARQVAFPEPIWDDGSPENIDENEELHWQELALCAQTDPEAFFPEKGGSTREAKRICVTCLVRSECLDMP